MTRPHAADPNRLRLPYECLLARAPRGGRSAGCRALIPKNAFGWPILVGLFFARVRTQTRKQKLEVEIGKGTRYGVVSRKAISRSLTPPKARGFGMTGAGVSKARTVPLLLRDERCGLFLVPFLISTFQFGGATSSSVFETICDADVLQPGGKVGPASGRETAQRCARRHPWL